MKTKDYIIYQILIHYQLFPFQPVDQYMGTVLSFHDDLGIRECMKSLWTFITLDSAMISIV